MKIYLLAFTLLSGAADLAGQQRGPVCRTSSAQAQPFFITFGYQIQNPEEPQFNTTGAVWLRLNSATGQLYQISYPLNSASPLKSLTQVTVNATPLIAPTDATVPGRFAL